MGPMHAHSCILPEHLQYVPDLVSNTGVCGYKALTSFSYMHPYSYNKWIHWKIAFFVVANV